MLDRLIIQNYALIDSLDVSFGQGFSVITGETGAGKSIIIGALNLLLGARADAKAVKQGTQQCRIEAHFTTNDSAFFEQNDIEFDGSQCIITRLISATGKSRVFINDTPCTLAQAKELGEQLIDIHSQHNNLLLQTAGFQLSFVDAVAQNIAQRKAYEQAYTKYCDKAHLLKELTQRRESQEREADYLQFQLQQLEEAAIIQNEDEELQQEIDRLAHAQELMQCYQSTAEALAVEETGVLPMLRAAFQQLRPATSIDANSQPLLQRIDQAYIELKDIVDELHTNASRVVIDPQRLQQAEERLDLINTLLHKHRLGSATSLVALKTELEDRLLAFQSLDGRIEQTRLELDDSRQHMLACAHELTKSRTAVVVSISRDIERTLALLGMPHARIQITVQPTQHPQPTGMDQVQFTVAANPNSPQQPLSTLSGGEAARVMLAVKDLLTQAVQLPTIIFDEIDTGVSGRIAESMATIMQRMGQGDRQVVAITHLPQIASRGDSHYRVFKTDDANVAHTNIQPISGEERVREIAAMLSGNSITDAAMDNARALLS